MSATPPIGSRRLGYAFWVSAGLLGACGGSGSSSTDTGELAAPSDTTAPVISVEPSSATLLSGGSIMVTVTASDDVAISSGPNATCTNGGSLVGDTFTAPMTTTDATSECTVTATDSSGNGAEATLRVDVVGAWIAALSLDLDALLDYEDQPVPDYINATPGVWKDNTGANVVTNAGATLGRVLFYDRNLSTTNTVACGSCHQQEHAFSDLAEQSQGVAGTTMRHSMRLINVRFAEEARFRWDETAATLEEQMTIPIRKAAEMGYSGDGGTPGFDQLITKLEMLGYYDELFALAFGSSEITELRIQLALAQFLRSIQSFDSRYDTGRAMVSAHGDDFPNFSDDENEGKRLFTEDYDFVMDTIEVDGELFSASRRTSGGLNCATCHRPPEFDIDPASLNNGFIRLVGQPGNDVSVTRSPNAERPGKRRR